MKHRILTGFAAQTLVIGLLSACSSQGAINSTAGFGASNGAQLSKQQRAIVDAAVRKIIKDNGVATIQSMEAANSKQADRTDVCGYVTYAVPAADVPTGALTSSAGPTQVRYFIQLGLEGGAQAAVMGQVASNRARRAKVDFMCKRAGLN